MSSKFEKLVAIADFSLNIQENNQVRTVSVRSGDVLSFDGTNVECLGLKGSAPAIKSALGKWLVPEGSAKSARQETPVVSKSSGTADVSEMSVLAKSLNAELPPSITRRVIESSDDYVVSRVRASALSETAQNPASVVMGSDKKSDSSVVFYEEREVKSNRPRVINAETQQGSSEGEVVRKVSAPPAVRTVEITPTTSTTDDSTSKITERTKQASTQAPKVKASESAMGEFSLESQGGVPVKTVTKINTETETVDGITSKVTFGKQSEDVATKAVFSKTDEGSSGEITLSKGDGSSMSQEFTVVGKVGQKKEAKQQTKEELPNDISIDIDELLETPDTEIASEKSLEYLGVPWASLHWIKKIEFINTVEDLKILKELQSKSDLSKAVKSALEKRIELVSSPVQV